MISAYYTFHVYIMHHFRGEKFFTGDYSEEYPQNTDLYTSSVLTVSDHLSWTLTSPYNAKADSKGTL